MLLLLVKHNRAIFLAVLLDGFMLWFFKVYMLSTYFIFEKDFSKDFFFQSQYCKCSKYTKPFIFLYCIYGLIIIKLLVVLLINSVNGLDAILGGSFSKVREQKIVPLGIRIWRPWLTQLALKRRAINHHCTPAVSSIYEIIKQVSGSIQRC